jgi:hypothetical protein
MDNLLFTFADAMEWLVPATGSGPGRLYRVVTLAGDLAPAGYSFLWIGGPGGILAAGPAGHRVAWRCATIPGQGAPVLAGHLYLTFSTIPDGVSEDTYIRWYAGHMRENLETPGFRHGWRFLTEAAGTPEGAAATGRHLAMYEIEGEWPELRRALDAAAPAKSASWPEWFARRQRVSFEATAL